MKAGADAWQQHRDADRGGESRGQRRRAEADF